MRQWLRGSLLVLCTLVATVGQAEEADSVVLIANPSVQRTTLSLEMVRAIFAMRQRTLPSGQAIHVFVLPDDAALHEAFAKRVLGVFPHQLRLAWDRAVFSGTGQAPNQVADGAAMLRAVASTPGSIGYLNPSSLSSQVQVLDID
ncbi:hypothetical protein [Salinicola avicenniae]|uniref:hypothetical protein n=1 Tax=Salinicola avicenniae TaxID=2916836 RepID=UPI002072D2D5|nr:MULTISPECIES: hypothetical protein [unclassified Salinicola]